MPKRRKKSPREELESILRLLFAKALARRIDYVFGSKMEIRATDRKTFDQIEAKAKRIMASEHGLPAVKIIAEFISIAGIKPYALFNPKYSDFKHREIPMQLYTGLLALAIYRERKTVLSLRTHEALLESLKKSGIFKKMGEEIYPPPKKKTR